MSIKSFVPTNKVFEVQTEFKAVSNDEDTELKIEGYASTVDKDRVGDVILSEAWTQGGLKNFEKNPILLFNHNYDTPIGKVTDFETDAKGLRVKGTISKAAGPYRELIKDGVLSTFSVGFLIKDADYDSGANIFVIKNAELLEVSVVSVPCNQDATFSVAKSFDSETDYQEFKSQFVASDDTTEDSSEDASEASGNSKKMDENDVKNIIAQALAASEEAARKKADKEAQEAARQKEFDDKVTTTVATATASVISEAEERIYAELEDRFNKKTIDLDDAVKGLETALAEKSEELQNLVNSKRSFSNRGEGSSNEWQKTFEEEIEDAFLLGRVTDKGYETEHAKQLLEKVNAHSSVEVSSEDFEQLVSTNVERDIQHELILYPMFREIRLNSATQILPIMPDVGYAEITSASGSTTGVAPHGTIDERGGSDRGGADLQEISLSTVKMVAKGYLGNETEEDAIMPLLPLIREAMIRQHARGVENLILLAGHADGAYSGLTAAQGLIKYCSTQSRDLNTGTTGTLPALTAAALLTLRKNMGKYGIRPGDIRYIVSERGYFELLEDAEFQDFNLVSNQATKLTGEVGQIFGSPVMVCDEFASAAAEKHYALAVNTRNFVIPRLRGITVESDYSVEDQHRVLVTTQRLGFKEIIPNAKSVFGLKYPDAS